MYVNDTGLCVNAIRKSLLFTCNIVIHAKGISLGYLKKCPKISSTGQIVICVNPWNIFIFYLKF